MRRVRRGAVLLLLGGAALAAGLALAGPASADGTETVPLPDAVEPAEPVLDEVFDEVDIDISEGGPDFDDPLTEVGSSMSGTADGDTAVLYRTDTNDDPNAPHSETWIWDGRTENWSEAPQTAATDPGPREFQAAAGLPVGDPTGDQALIYGGDNGGTLADTWVLDNNYEWYQACNPCNPGPLLGASGANSEWESFLFGGTDGTNANNNLWMWNGTALDWDPVVPLGPAPAARVGAAFAFDGVDFILFGGMDDFSGTPVAFGDTWRLYLDAGGNWVWELVPTAVAPAPRSFPGFAGLYWRDDPEPGAVLVGGYQPLDDPNYDVVALSDMWAWNGSGWILADAGIGSYPLDFQDPSTWVEGVPYSPKAAAMPTIGAMVWTAGNCSPVTEECTRITEQINLTRDVAVAGLPFTGSRLDFIAALALILIAAGTTAGIAGHRRRNTLDTADIG